MESPEAGTLYVVSTPIGNLEDVTLRALRVLREVSVIAAEDTRVTRKLLSRHDIHTPLVSLREHSSPLDVARLVDRLSGGEDVAFVSDAGTPGVSDPGPALVRQAIAAGIRLVPVPGASAVLAALVGSGLPLDRFRFVGFVSRQASQRRKQLQDLATARETLVFFEAPHRIRATLADMIRVFGPRPSCAARELTKIHEEFIRAPITELPEALPETIRGEWTVLVGGAQEEDAADGAGAGNDWREDLRRRLAAGESSKDAARAVAEAHGLSRREVYAEALRLRL